MLQESSFTADVCFLTARWNTMCAVKALNNCNSRHAHQDFLTTCWLALVGCHRGCSSGTACVAGSNLMITGRGLRLTVTVTDANHSKGTQPRLTPRPGQGSAKSLEFSHGHCGAGSDWHGPGWTLWHCECSSHWVSSSMPTCQWMPEKLGPAGSQQEPNMSIHILCPKMW